MRLFVAIVFGVTALAAQSAHAQTPAAPASGAEKGYAEVTVQSAFGNATSQSYGVEAGYRVWRDVQVFADVGHIRTAAPSTLGADAQVIAGFLGAGYSAKEPVTFAAFGVRYPFRDYLQHGLTPYVLAGGGFARVTKDVHFILNGTDITGAIEANPDQYGVALGSDLAGTTNNGLLVIGGGVTWAAWRQLVVDFQYRYGRVFSEDINTNRAGVGIGWRF